MRVEGVGFDKRLQDAQPVQRLACRTADDFAPVGVKKVFFLRRMLYRLGRSSSSEGAGDGVARLLGSHGVRFFLGFARCGQAGSVFHHRSGRLDLPQKIATVWHDRETP